MDVLNDAKKIIDRHICGFHRYVLSGTPHLSYASENLCKMTGFSKAELLSEKEDCYARMVHPADIGKYSGFISALKEKERSLSAEYRIIKKGGEIIFVCDTATSEKLGDGTMVCSSSLADITGVMNENSNLRFLNETIPCGFVKYTCEKQPKITYINRRMLELLRFPEKKEGEPDYLELCKDNVFLLVPADERRRFSLYLNRVYSAGKPLAGEIALQRYDGSRAYVSGWVTKIINESGEEEFQSVCMDITERHHEREQSERNKYIKALSDVYDKIFEYDFTAGTVKCLSSNNSPMFRWVENIPMQMEDATEKWVTNTVVGEERERVRAFFGDFFLNRFSDGSGKPPQITYRATSSSGEIKNYRGVMIKIDDKLSLYCLRCISDSDIENIKKENAALKANIQDIVTHFTDGIAAFVVRDGLVTPLFAGENVYTFFGQTEEEWLEFMKKGTPLKAFVAKSDIEYEDFENLFRDGEGEFIYYDAKTESEKRIRAVCSQKSSNASAPQYVMLYKAGEVENKAQSRSRREIVIRTFGYFDVFVDGRPVAFRNKKSKELFALLVDRRGGFVTSEEAIGFLWEDEAVNPVTQARYRKVALRLKNLLEEYNIVDIVETVEGKRRIVAEKVKCDLYDYLSGREDYSQLFKGSYLTNYSWAETTLAELTHQFL